MLKIKRRRNTSAKEWYAKNKKDDPEFYKEKQRIYSYKRKYGITIEDYDRMLIEQNGHCALCDKTPEQERNGKLNVDHCHETGKVRGLLCMWCNHTLGRMGDNEEGVRKFLNYVAKNSLTMTSI